MTGPRIATCRCGQLRVVAYAEPVRISVCHCLNCQQRSGSAFAAQARFAVEHVRISGDARQWVQAGDSGNRATFHFCPTCGATGWYVNEAMPETVAIPIGNFADPAFPGPRFSVFENRKHAWVQITGDGIEHD